VIRRGAEGASRGPRREREEVPASVATRRERAERLRPYVARWVEVLGAEAVAARTGMHVAGIKQYVRQGITPLSGALDAYEEMLSAEEDPEGAYADWVPTEIHIATLPPPLRRFFRELQARNDPNGLVAELIVMREQLRVLTRLVEELRPR
jgi:hypothetical protein